MASEPLIKTNFNGGMLSPEMFGRTDNDKLHSGSALLLNMLPTVSGALVRRPGTKRLNGVIPNDTPIRPFVGRVPADNNTHAQQFVFGDTAHVAAGALRIMHFNPSTGVNYDIIITKINVRNIFNPGSVYNQPVVAVFNCNTGVWRVYQYSSWTSSYGVPSDAQFRDAQYVSVADTMWVTIGNCDPIRIRYTGMDAFTLDCPFYQGGNTSVIGGQLRTVWPPFTDRYGAMAQSAVGTVTCIRGDTEKVIAKIRVHNTVPGIAGIAVGGRIELPVEGNHLFGVITAKVADGLYYNVTLECPAQITIINDKTSRFYRAYQEDSRSATTAVLRTDKVQFSRDHENSWVRVPFNFLYPKWLNADTVQDPALSGSTAIGAKMYHWVKLLRYRGVDTFPSEYLVRENFSSSVGSVSEPSNLKNYKTNGVYRIAKQYSNVPSIVVPINGTDYTYNAAGDAFTVQSSVKTITGATTARVVVEDITQPVVLDQFDVGQTMYTVIDGAAPSASQCLSLGEEEFSFDPVNGIVRIAQVWQNSSTYYTLFGWSCSIAKLGDYNVSLRPYEGDSSWYNTTPGHSYRWFELDAPLPRKGGSVVNDGVLTDWYTSMCVPGNQPTCVSIFEGRLVFAGFPARPETIVMSSLTNPLDFRHVERDGKVLATSGIQINLGGTQAAAVRWMAVSRDLLVGTTSGEWSVGAAGNATGVTPTTVTVKQQSFYGSTGPIARVVNAGSDIVFISGSGDTLISYGYDYRLDQYIGRDLLQLSRNVLRSLGVSLDDAGEYAEHPDVVTDVGRNLSIYDVVFQRTPLPLIWLLLSNGYLASITYSPQEGVFSPAIHRLGRSLPTT